MQPPLDKMKSPGAFRPGIWRGRVLQILFAGAFLSHFDGEGYGLASGQFVIQDVLDGPTCFDAVDDNILFHTKLPAPFGLCLRPSAMHQHYGIASIPSLLRPRRPSAISGGIPGIIINAFQCLPGRACAHVSEEQLEGFPSVADGYTQPDISRVFPTPLPHSYPIAMLSCTGHAVRCVGVPLGFCFACGAAGHPPVHEFVSGDDEPRAAFALAFPPMPIRSRRPPLVSNHRDVTEHTSC